MGGIFGESHEEKEKDSIINRLIGIIENLTGDHPRKLRPVLAFNILNNNSNYNFMAVLSSLTLTSTAPVTLFMTVLDSSNGNALIAGALTGLAYTPADPTQDLAVVDPTTATDVDIHAVSPSGGTTLAATGTFVSTLLQADNVTPVFSGPVSGTLTIVNNVVVAATMTPVLAFNQ
jgi:hypothetical protein